MVDEKDRESLFKPDMSRIAPPLKLSELAKAKTAEERAKMIHDHQKNFEAELDRKTKETAEQFNAYHQGAEKAYETGYKTKYDAMMKKPLLLSEEKRLKNDPKLIAAEKARLAEQEAKIAGDAAKKDYISNTVVPRGVEPKFPAPPGPPPLPTRKPK
jgi:hypothetical protein